MKIEGAEIRIFFDHTGGGLVADKKAIARLPYEPDPWAGSPLKWFEVAGEDHIFHWATAMIDRNTVVVSSLSVTEPKTIRYAWNRYPAGANLYNTDGLPASPFSTSLWKLHL